MKTLIKDVRIVDATIDTFGSVLIEDGKIKKLFNNEAFDGEAVEIEGHGLVLMPSFIDMHTHLREPGYTQKETLETGQRAALKGGYTVLCPMANTSPVCDDEYTMEYVKEKAKKLNMCEIMQVCAVTKELEGKENIDFNKMKVHTNLFSDDGKTIFDDEIMRNTLIKSKELNFLVLTHSQPETEIVKRDMKLMEQVGGNLHVCHISKKDTLEEIKRARKEGIKVTCEVAPHHVFDFENEYKVNPSFRTKEDMESMIEGMKLGYIDVIGTDHAPHTSEDKINGAPGISNIEVAFSMVNKVFYDNNLEIKRLSEMMSKRPAEILNLNKGLIKEGYDADLVLVNIDETYKIDTKEFISKGKNNPFDGREVRGRVKMTIRKGEIVYDNRQTL